LKKPPFRNNRKPLHRINSHIRNEEVRVLLDDGEQLGVMKTEDAISIAKDRKMDLVEIASSNNPPVCKIIDYGKFKYQEQKKKMKPKRNKKLLKLRKLKLDLVQVNTTIR
tara:strand:+ start:289 stop:618 length:330 start_codon:yes stop_codon:yes gene_type:complete